jgi:hypothetical protein
VFLAVLFYYWGIAKDSVEQEEEIEEKKEEEVKGEEQVVVKEPIKLHFPIELGNGKKKFHGLVRRNK